MSKRSKKSGGWFNQPARHSLASKGIPTKHLTETEAKNLIANGLIGGDDPTAEDMSKMSPSQLKKDRKKREKSAKKRKKKAKELKKEAGADWWSKFKSGIGSAVKKGKDVLKKGKNVGGNLKEFLSNEEDKKMGSMISDDLQTSMSQTIAGHKGEDVDRDSSDYTKEDIKQLKESGTPAQLLQAIRKGDVIDADAIEISDENSQELSQHLGDLKHDAKVAEQMAEQMNDTYKEMRRYYKQQYEEYSDELHDEWDRIKDSLSDSEREKQKNEYKHKEEMRKIQAKSQITEYEANVEYAEDVAKVLDKIYDERKELVKRLVS